MKVIIGEARDFYDGYDPDTESGIICQCGKVVIIKNKDREPITAVQLFSAQYAGFKLV